MEHAGARDAYTYAYVYIYTLYLLLSLPLMKEASGGWGGWRGGGAKGAGHPLATRASRLMMRSVGTERGTKGAGSRLPHRPAMCFRASRVSGGGSSIQIEEG